MFTKGVYNLFICVRDEKVWDKKTDDYYHLVKVLHEDTLKENYLYYHGYVEAFNRVSDMKLYRIIEKLLVKPKYSKFTLWQDVDITMIA